MNSSNSPDGMVREFCRHLARSIDAGEFTKILDDLRHCKVLVVGETIFDRYSYVRVQGLTSKNRILSGRYLSEETQGGGALAVYRHVREFTPHVRFVSLVGTETWVEPRLANEVRPEHDLVVRDSAYTTIIKQRFVEPVSKGKEMSKLFAVNFLEERPPAEEVVRQLGQRLREAAAWADAVLVADFGHGLMQPELRRLAENCAPFLALNCQTNSNNHGFNVISRQYQRADAFSLDAQELMLSCGQRHPDFAAELESLRRQLRAHYAWLTRGAVETVGLHEGEARSLCPPLENDVVDTVGAGDAFFSVASLAAARGLPVDVGTFLGQLAGAQAVRIVGNAHPISRDVLLKTGTELLTSARP